MTVRWPVSVQEHRSDTVAPNASHSGALLSGAMPRARVHKRLTVSQRKASHGLVTLLTLAHLTSASFATDAQPPPDAAEQDEFRQRLTEREDKLRTAQPLQIDVAGRPLTLSGEVGFDLEQLRRPASAGTAPHRDHSRTFVLEAEAFYSINTTFALFAQMRLEQARQRGASAQGGSTHYAERGEMWLYGKSIAGSEMNVELGRLKFDDDRRWWWDQELDAARLSYESDGVEVAMAFARELARNRTHRSSVEPERYRVGRWLTYAKWDWAPDQELSFVALRQDDRSAIDSPGQIIADRERDESDARLTWLGAGVAGKVTLAGRGVLSYTIDSASVRGSERLSQFDPRPAQTSVVSDVTRRDVRGWALDAGLRWTAAAALAPRVFVAYAYGSGGVMSQGADRSFRQTGLQKNESGFGGVKRFEHYGAALDPELSNLRITTLGAGLSPAKWSSIDLVYHHYRQVSPATSLRTARFSTDLTGSHRDIGTGFDFVAAIKGWKRIELSAIASTFRSGAAFAAQAGRTYTFGTLEFRVAF